MKKSPKCLNRCQSASLLLLMAMMLAVISACDSGSGMGLDANGRPLDDSGGGMAPPDDSLFGQVQNILDSNCTQCHAGASAPLGLVLTPGEFYDATVSVPSDQQSDLLRIDPGNPNESYLIRKIRGDSDITGVRMPANGLFLSSGEIDTIIAWAAEGAPRAAETDPDAEFVAELNNFSGYQSWAAIDYSVGMSNPFLGGLHGSDGEIFARRVYANSSAMNPTETGFANGSILVKEVFSYQDGEKTFAEMGGLLAMVKRGGDYNADHGAWEWFMLAPDLSEIAGRGGDLMEGGCNSCHQQAEFEEGEGFGGLDYVFLHPSTFIADNDSFVGYQDWHLIDERSDDNPLLNGMAHSTGEIGDIRKIYKKQLYANPDTQAQGYPVATQLVKEVIQDGVIVEVTAMAKRGGDVETLNGAWEWFMLDPQTQHIMVDDEGNAVRGEDLMEGMCANCHAAANPATGHGIDGVFKHPGDPFNNDAEFFAELASFADYAQWDLVDYSIGRVTPAIGGGHQGQNDSFARLVYANPEAMNFENAVYPKGSIFVKEVVTWEQGEKAFAPELGLVAMAKRGENFNLEHNGWEWFELEPDLSQIIGRGAEYRNNGCNSCHQGAVDGVTGYDYVFHHPSEFIAQSDNFTDYTNWALIDERTDQNPLLGEAAHGVDQPERTRKVYKKQTYAAPLAQPVGYPVGTTIVKEVIEEGEIIELLAMVKRGGTFNADHNHWEWFILDPQSAEIREDDQGEEIRGAGLMEGMCNGCHAAAKDNPDVGQDYVFIHENDPVFSADQ